MAAGYFSPEGCYPARMIDNTPAEVD